MTEPKQTTVLPIWSLATVVALVALAIVALIFVDMNSTTTPILVTIIGLVVTVVPALIAATYSEKTNRQLTRDEKNGRPTV